MVWKLLSLFPTRKISIYADFIDPFCYIGFHNLKTVAEARGIPLEWRGFELNPETPLEGYALETAANSDLRPGMWASVKALAQQSSLEFPEPQRVPNTRSAHQLVQGIKNWAVKIPLIERIYQAYFRGRQDIGRPEILMPIAASFRISPNDAEAALRDGGLGHQVDRHREEAKRHGFAGMPGFVVRGKTYFGALSKEAWGKIIEERLCSTK